MESFVLDIGVFFTWVTSFIVTITASSISRTAWSTCKNVLL